MRLRRDHEVRAARQKGLGRGAATVSSAVGLILGSFVLLFGLALPADASPGTVSYPITTNDCKHGGWADFSALGFRNQGQCVTWVQHTIVHEDCLPAALADFQETGPTYAAQLGIPLEEFLAAVCHGQDFPVSNAWYLVDDPAGTDLLSLSSGHTTALVTQLGHIYWITVQGAWFNGLTRQADARYISDDGWLTWAEGPASDPLNLETQINDQFVDWGPYNTSHNYSYWITGDGNPINLRVFEGDPATNTPNAADYADNTGIVPGVEGMPAIVFEYALPT